MSKVDQFKNKLTSLIQDPDQEAETPKTVTTNQRKRGKPKSQTPTEKRFTIFLEDDMMEDLKDLRFTLRKRFLKDVIREALAEYIRKHKRN